jgi:hypothetical protein
MSNVERRRTIADQATPTPRSRNGLNLSLKVSLYDTDGHSAISSNNVILSFSTDHELIAEFAKLVGKLRQQQQQSGLLDTE